MGPASCLLANADRLCGAAHAPERPWDEADEADEAEAELQLCP